MAKGRAKAEERLWEASERREKLELGLGLLIFAMTTAAVGAAVGRG